MKPLRVGIVCDFVEEGWFSMDLIGDMLMKSLPNVASGKVHAVQLRPAMTRRWSRLPVIGRSARAHLADRLRARVWDYPRWLRRQVHDFDVFHVVDHSYAHVVRALPRERTVVTCNDVDAIEPALGQGLSTASGMLARSVLSGVSNAAHVACISEATKAALISTGRVDPNRVSVVYLGVEPSCTASPVTQSACEILHVGSTIPRKRIDVLLEVFAGLRRYVEGLQLVRVGGPLSSQQRALAKRLGVLDAIVEMPHLDRAELTQVYRRAAVVLLPSEREGFGLPLIEAMASGTPVVASAIPALREVGADAAVYCPPGDVSAWIGTVKALLDERTRDPQRWAVRREHCIRNARRFSWNAYATQMTNIYFRMAAQ